MDTAKTANISLNTYPELKAEAESVFAYHGLSLSDAINVFLNHACRVGGFPFDLRGARWNDPISLAALEECNNMENNSDVKVFYTTDELFADCLGDDDD